jgi:4-diphosphocytidyl-2-C-methyl-D-erythritol kinase
VLRKYPLLQIFQELMRENGALAAMMSGSGSTTFALVRGKAAAESLSDKFVGKFGNFCWVSIAPLG